MIPYFLSLDMILPPLLSNFRYFKSNLIRNSIPTCLHDFKKERIIIDLYKALFSIFFTPETHGRRCISKHKKLLIYRFI
ncbi:hypothetical protein HanHA300_Chr09g0325401 [Helianthus annuus]|nr:hypothetical protein HanHA300_Chr09g0325401 [Helianthus annuus]KAJ0543030.1 hypothetical protein HanHA89_Chr09g0346331 [Helianthus annuus]KAJ0708084.1 hypothetical protein HanLR1_Chr09g0325651 [Helianthus annuus]